MERYHQLIEQLAEWFMQLFFDPAYHLVSEESSQNIIVRKKQEVSDWWVKQKAALLELAKPSKPDLSHKMMIKLKKRIDINDTVSPLVFYLSRRWRPLIS
ncbi:hypothetical protein [Carboxylicivirga sp. RSCT41]|uniref:hypothetical protein n=1 Tax=Carboxylicivirga agarovorans TaxID=3417570 RepID=UPI003D34FA1F